MATLTAVTAVRTGVTMVPVAAAGGGDQFLNFGREIVYVKNASGGSITLTFAPAGLPGGLALATYTVVVAPAAERIIGPFDPAYFSSVAGVVTITYSGVTSLTVALLSVPCGTMEDYFGANNWGSSPIKFSN